ncbi:hypothetical protein K2805_004987 [Salmonella enterica]|nr:hypothetical protein [Salmonella enterica]EIB9795938.1 hypothetical protein [Salmonella enterica subsp. enterica serovar Teshie]EIB9851348.1 hypothetical protein [Salmonella enterica subsp. enterica serovar Teshie]EIL4070187.1 hypothetical protein [Salmonella enterica]
MKKYLIVALMVFASSAMAKIGYVDEHQKQVDLKVDSLTKKYEKDCKGKRNSNMCKSQARSKARFEFENEFRGGEKYSKEHYGNLTKDQAAAKLHELIKLYDVVDKDDRNPEMWKGKIHPLMVNAEINYIIKKYWPTRIDTCGKICAELLLRQIGK